MMHWIDLARPREIGSLADRVRRESGQYKLALGGGSQKQRPRLEVSGIIKHYIIQNWRDSSPLKLALKVVYKLIQDFS